MYFDQINERIRKLTWDVLAVDKIAVIALTLLAAKLWPSILGLEWYWYAVILVAAKAYVIPRFLGNRQAGESLMKSRIVIFALAGLTIAMCLYFHNLMPERIATHFDINGVPNGWMSRNGLLIFNIVLILVMTAAFSVIPFKAMNIPNRDYWLHPSRMKDTESAAMGLYTRTGAATLIFLMGVLCLMYRANLSAQVNLGQDIWIYMAVFVIYILAESAYFLLRFNRKG